METKYFLLGRNYFFFVNYLDEIQVSNILCGTTVITERIIQSVSETIRANSVIINK